MRLLLFLQYCFFVGIATLCSTANAFAQDGLDLHARLGKVDTPGIFLDPACYSWCSTVIKGEDGRYHMFYSRWPHSSRAKDDDTMNHIFDGFRGWNKYSEIAYAVADHIQGPYRYLATILKGDVDKNRCDSFTMHNPQVRKFGAHYYLYYVSNSYDSSLFRDNTSFSAEWKHWLQYNAMQKTGVLKFRNFKELLAGNAKRSVAPLMQHDGVNTFEVTTNPSVTQGPDVKYYMMFKSGKPNGVFCSFMTLLFSLLFPVIHNRESEKLCWSSPWEPLKGKAWKGLGNYRQLTGLLLLIMVTCTRSFINRLKNNHARTFK